MMCMLSASSRSRWVSPLIAASSSRRAAQGQAPAVPPARSACRKAGCGRWRGQCRHRVKYRFRGMRMNLAACAVLAAALATAAMAQEPAARPGAEAAKPVSRTALSDELNSDYADLDTDKDGKVTADEIKTRLV